MQTEMSRGPLAEDEHSRQGMVGGGLRTIPFLPWSSSAVPLAFLSAFVHGLVGQPLTCSNTVLIEIARALRKTSISQPIISDKTSSKFDPSSANKINMFYKISYRNPYRSIEHEQIYILGRVRASKSIRTSKKAPNTPTTSVDLSRPRSTSVDLSRPRVKPFKNHPKLRIWVF